MFPILFHIGSFPIHTYGALGAAAFLTGAGIALWRGTRLGMDQNRLADVIFWMAITSLLGARLVFVLQNPETVSSLGEFLDLRGGGLVFYGSFLVGLPVGFALMHRYKLAPFAVWDLFGTAFPIAHAISRVGCYAAGCCYGSPTDPGFPWAITYPHDHPLAPSGVPVHPVQLYEAAALLGIGLLTNLFYPYRRFDGQVFLLYLVLYAAARPVLEIFRGDIDRGWFLPELLGQTLTWSQGMSAVFAVFALVVFFFGARSRSARLSTAAQGPS
jgi:phosphatidylglycerol:prolipoprotein diacylglycerol transferase